jgi:hypothetical protein
LLEKNIEEPVKREVDILIEKCVNGKTVRIAVECRDRADRDDIEWIDGLIGKYKNLEVHKVIAVSNSGFSRAAFLKAKVNHIELRTLEEASQIDFEREFKKLGMVYVSPHTFKPHNYSLEFASPISYKPTENDAIYKDGESLSSISIKDFVRICIREITDKKVKEYLRQNFLKIFETRADLDKRVLIEHKVPLEGLYLKSSSGLKHYLLSLTIRMIGDPKLSEIGVRQRSYEKSLISEMVIDDEDLMHSYTIRLAQIAGKGEGRLFWQRRKKKGE